MLKLISTTLLLFAFVTGFAQLPEDEFKLSFTKEKAPVNDEMERELDSIARFMESGSSLHLPLLTKRELKKDDKFAKELSFRRYKNIVKYFVENPQPFVTVSEVVQPMSQVKNAKASSNASYKAFAKGTSGIYSIILHRGENAFKGYTASADALEDVPVQEFTIDCQFLGMINGANGTRIIIPSEAFATDVNDCCRITIKLREYTQLSQMIQGNLSTHSNGNILQTAGSIHISAWCNGKELSLRDGKQLAIYFTSEQEQKMKAFWGNETADDDVNWVLDEDGKVVTLDNELGPWPPLDKDDLQMPIETEDDMSEQFGGFDSEWFYEYAQETDGYLMTTSKLGWINCDRFYELLEEEKMDFFVKIPEVKGTAVRLVFNDIGSILPASHTQYANMVCFRGVPRDNDATLLAYSKKGDKYYLKKQALNAEQGAVVEMEVTEISKAEFDAQIKAL